MIFFIVVGVIVIHQGGWWYLFKWFAKWQACHRVLLLAKKESLWLRLCCVSVDCGSVADKLIGWTKQMALLTVKLLLCEQNLWLLSVPKWPLLNLCRRCVRPSEYVYRYQLCGQMGVCHTALRTSMVKDQVVSEAQQSWTMWRMCLWYSKFVQSVYCVWP